MNERTHTHTQSKVYSTEHTNGNLTSHFIAHRYGLCVNSLQQSLQGLTGKGKIIYYSFKA